MRTARNRMRLRHLVAVATTGITAAALTLLGQPNAFADPDCTGVTSWSALATTFGAGGAVVLCGDITAPSGQHLTVGASATVLDLNGYHLTIDDPGFHQPAIGVSAGRQLTIQDTSFGTPGAVTVTGGDSAAGIGGGYAIDGTSKSGTLTITGGTVTATGGGDAAGIGGGYANHGTSSAGTVTITGGTVTATGSTFGAGIGGGYANGGTSSSGTLTVTGGTVTATGSAYGAGIGGGYAYGGTSSAGTVTVTAGTVTATGGSNAAGIGGGYTYDGISNSAAVTIGSGAMVTARGSGSFSAIGAGSGNGSFGSLSNAGTLTIPSGARLIIPAGNSVDNPGSLTGAGTIVNHGAIVTGGAGTVGPGLTVTDHNYLLSFSTVAGTVTPGTVHVYAASTADSGQALPTPQNLPTGTGFALWRDSTDTTVAADTDLTGYGTAGSTGTPVAIGLHATLTQTITLTSTVPDPARPGGTYTPQATGGASGNPIGFTAGPSAVCTADGGIVTFHTAGDCTVTATQPGSSDFLVATASQQIAVTGFPVTVGVSGPPRAPVGSSVPLDITVTASDPAAGTPTGSVTLTAANPDHGTITLGTATLGPDGTAAFTTRDLPAGVNTITAAYSGDTVFTAGAGQTIVIITIPPAPTINPPWNPAATASLAPESTTPATTDTVPATTNAGSTPTTGAATTTATTATVPGTTTGPTIDSTGRASGTTAAATTISAATTVASTTTLASTGTNTTRTLTLAALLLAAGLFLLLATTRRTHRKHTH